ncbi:MAG: ABC-type xylose transport system permease subunit, partial [Arenicella sp.]
KLISDRILILQRINYNFDSEQLDVIADFYAGALIGTIQGWLLDDTGVKNVDTVITTVGRLFANGLDSFVTKDS